MTKNQLQLLRRLQQRKHRQAQGLFVVEGEKNVLEVLESDWQLDTLFASTLFLEKHQKSIQKSKVQVVPSKINELERAGSFQSNKHALLTIKKPQYAHYQKVTKFSLVLDNINDPGNLGTILRIADWYGIAQVICSLQTVDVFNPKVISASMGSFLRVQVDYQDLATFLQKQDLPIYGALLHGENLHEKKLPKDAIVVIGSESHGISESLRPFVSYPITIPRFGQAESLNAAVATAIICDNWRRFF